MNVERVLKLVVDAEILSDAESREWDSYWKEQGQSPDDGDGLVDCDDPTCVGNFAACPDYDCVPDPTEPDDLPAAATPISLIARLAWKPML